jgi:7-carboxy-7-deazaguanine synthase (Cx14CxxC type)
VYTIKEIFFSLQGEGAQTGRASIFCRFAGCNLWSGREQDRSKAVCNFCDTDFVGINGHLGGKYQSAQELSEVVKSLWPENASGIPYVICTGGEPLLQLDTLLIEAFHKEGFEVAVETNGTLPVPPGIDWVCVSPKGNSEIVVTNGNELKLVYPQHHAHPEHFGELSFDYFYLQPLDESGLKSLITKSNDYVREAIKYCTENPQWRLSLQTHKILGIE